MAPGFLPQGRRDAEVYTMDTTNVLCDPSCDHAFGNIQRGSGQALGPGFFTGEVDELDNLVFLRDSLCLRAFVAI